MNNIKSFLSGLGGIGFGVLIIGSFFLLIVGGAKLFEVVNPVLETIGTIVWGIIFLLILLSVVPRFREFTGGWIVIGTYIVGAIVWFTCFFITYSLWGFFGIFIGVMMFGLGVFFTAILSLIFDGQLAAAFIISITLTIIYLMRMFGYWIISKHKTRIKLKEIN